MRSTYKDFLIRDWVERDRTAAADVVKTVLEEYGLGWEASCGCGAGADQDAVQVEAFYLERGGEFWVIEKAGSVVGTGGYHPIERGENAVEIRKMYLLPSARGYGLGRYLLSQLEQAAAGRGFDQAWVETASVLEEAVRLYERNGYEPMAGVETERCDRVYCKSITTSVKAYEDKTS